MNLVDANVLLHAVNSDSPHHCSSVAWLDAALFGASTVAVSWVSLLAFVRLSTEVGLFPSPLSSNGTPISCRSSTSVFLSDSGSSLRPPHSVHSELLGPTSCATGTGSIVWFPTRLCWSTRSEPGGIAVISSRRGANHASPSRTGAADPFDQLVERRLGQSMSSGMTSTR